MSPYSLAVCLHQGGDGKAEDFDLVAVFWFYCLSSPWLWQLPVQPWGSWVVLLCPGNPQPWAPLPLPPRLWILTACPGSVFVVLLPGWAWELLESLWDFCGWSAAMSYYIFWEVLVQYSAAAFWGFSLPCCSGFISFGFFFFFLILTVKNVLKTKDQWKLM